MTNPRGRVGKPTSLSLSSFSCWKYRYESQGSGHCPADVGVWVKAWERQRGNLMEAPGQPLIPVLWLLLGERKIIL